LSALPSTGRATRVEPSIAPEADATRDLYERFSGQIFGYCLHQLGSREEAEDAVQTTFMNAFRGLRRGIVPQVESAWLFKIAHNVCLSRRRSTRRRGKVEAPNNFEVLQEVVPARERMGDELIRVQDVLEDMPETQRRAILLREWQGLSYCEIASELGITQSAVETLIFRARRSLASGLEVEPAQWRKRARHGFDAGAVMAALKGLLSTGTAAKVAATIAVATTAAVAVSDAHHPVRAARPHVSATDVLQAQRTDGSPSLSAAVTPSRTLASRVTVAPMHHVLSTAHRSGAAAQPSPASTRTLSTVTSIAGHAGSAHRGAFKSSPARHATHGLAKGHEKHAQTQKEPQSIQAVPPANGPKQQNQPDVTDPQPDGGQSNGHGHG
jgi:RNA polymerase sigma factor (sigma-70 family)